MKPVPSLLHVCLLACLVPLFSTAAIVRKPDLALHFELNESEGTIANDASGNEFEGSLNGDPVWESGLFGNGLRFDGNNDEIVVAHDVKLNVEAYTVSLWFKPEKNNENWTGVFGRPGRCYNFWLNRSNQNDWSIHHRFWDQAATNSGAPDSRTFNMGEWRHIALTNDASVVRTYVDGLLQVEGPVQGPLVYNESNLFIGSNPDEGGKSFFQGMLDDVRLYSVALNREEVAKLYGFGEGDFQVLTSARIVSGKVGEELSYLIEVDVEATGFAVQGLPEGLALDAVTGVVSGTPNNAGSAKVDLVVTTADGEVSEVFHINISDGSTFAFKPATGSLEINTSTGKILHGEDGELQPFSHEVKDGVSIFTFDSVQLDEGVTVNLVGDKPLSIRTTGGDIILSTLLDVSGTNGSSGNSTLAIGRAGGGNGSPGRQWNSEFANRGQGLGGGYTYRYAGAGGSFGGLGGPMRRNNAQRWNDENPWPPTSPSTYGDAALSNLVAGSGGGSTHRAGGGAGGGAIELAADGDGKIHITTTGSILANGGNAGNENHPETAGAGSGGAIKLSGASIINEGTLSVRGGVSVRANNDWGGESSGGNGGGGRIAFHTSGELELGSYDLSGGGNINNYVQLVIGGDLVADSIEDFSGTQGGDGWSYGYTTVFGSYDLLDFTLFPGGTGEGEWSGTQHWTGSDDNKVGSWDFKPVDGSGNPPWTVIHNSSVHPNSGAGIHHSAIRRWTSGIEGTIGLAGYFQNSNAGGNGTRGNIYHNGQLVSSSWTDGFRTDFNHIITVATDDILDFVIDTGNTNNDGNDGTNFHVQIFQNPTTKWGRPTNLKRVAGYHGQAATAGTIAIIGQTGKGELAYSDGLLTIDTTSAFWSHSSGEWGGGTLVEDIASVHGQDAKVHKAVFEFSKINLGPDVGVHLIGENPLVLKTKDGGDIVLDTSLNASGGTAVPGLNWYSPGGAGILGGADGGIRGRDNNGNVAPSIFDGNGPGYGSDGRYGGGGAGYAGTGGRGRGGNGGEAGLTYGLVDIPVLLGGSGGGGGETGSGSGGGGAIELNADGNLTINADITANGGESPNSSQNGGAGSGGSLKIIGRNVTLNDAALEARGGDVRMVDGRFDRSGGAGGGGRIFIGYRENYTLNPPMGTFPSDGLYSRWQFDEGEGNLASDSEGRNPGELHVSMPDVSWRESPLLDGGKALYFDGVDDYVDIGVTGIKGNAVRTIAGWVKSDTTVFDAWTGIFGFQGATTNQYFDFQIDAWGHYTLHVHGAQYPVTPLDLRWHHLAASYDGTHVRIYLDGNHRRTVARTLNTIDGFFIGGRPTHGTYFNGLVDDVCLWDRVLSDEEIKALVRPKTLINVRGGNDSRYGSAQNGTVLILEDTGQPVITLTGDSVVTHEGGAAYEDAGATLATSNGELLDATLIEVSGLPDGMTLGEFIITYNFIDEKSSPASEVTRVVNVVDTTAPLLSLVGGETVQVIVGEVYVDAGATALDAVDGELSPNPTSEKPAIDHVPGLLSGYLAGNINTQTQNPGNWGIDPLGTSHSETTTSPPWAGNRTIIYTGQIYDADGIISFTENIDDKVRLSVGGQNVLNNDAWNQRTEKSLEFEDGGWFEFELRISNGGGGAGVVEGVGFGYDPDGGTDYVPPRNSEGEMNLFRVEITKHNEIDTSEEGTFKITYNVADSTGNTATVVRIIEVVPEITTPVLTLVGEVAVSSEAGSVYEDAGATVAKFDGEALDASKIVVSGIPDANSLPGIYLVTYDFEDEGLGKANQVRRTVTVVDTTAPVLTLVGEAEVRHQIGTPFNDPGATSTDIVDGDLPIYSSEVFSKNKLLHQGFIINARLDSHQNLVNGGGLLRETPSGAAIFTTGPADRGLAYNNDGDFRNAGVGISRNNNFQNLWTGLFKARVDGEYEFGIAAKDDRTTFWLDLDQNGMFDRTGEKGDERLNNGLATGFRTVELSNGLYKVAIGHAEFAGGSRITAQVKTPLGAGPPERANVKPADLLQDGLWGLAEPIDIWQAGTYVLTYESTDSNGNSASVERTVIVEVLPSAPVITLNGENPIDHEAGPDYFDPGASVADGEGNVLSLEPLKVDGSVDSKKPGEYELTYTYIAENGLEATPIIRKVVVADTIAPELTLVGDAEITVWLGADFTDPGASATDNFDGEISVSSSEAVPQDKLVFHLDASAIVGKRTGDPVPVWYDKSAAENHADDATGVPTYIADGINGHPVVHFDGNDTLAVSRSIDNRYTILTVSRLEGTQNFRLLTSKTQNWLMGYWNNYEDVFYTSGWATDQVNTATSRAHLYTVTNNGKVMADARLFANGLDITDDPLRPRGFVGNFQMGGWSQGRDLSIGDVSEVIAYERQLTDGERRAVEAYLLGKYGLSEQVGISPVNTQVEGEYMVTYGATDAAGNTTVKTRKIIIKANPATPVITLVGETILEHQAGYEFTEPGFNLSTGTGDALDADLVDVQGSVNSFVLTLHTLRYNYTDADGNKAVERVRHVNVIDSEPPVITLNGESTVRLEVGGFFEDLGASALDKFEGELRAFSSLGIPGEGLLAYWEFDEFEGTSAQSTNGRIGVLTNFDGSQWVEGKRGNALSFDGTNDYVVLPVEAHPKSSDPEAAFAFWAYGGDKLPRNNSVLESGSFGNNDRVMNIHHPWGNGQTYWDAGGNRINKAVPAVDQKGSWVHWVFSINRTSGSQKIYKNGELWHQAGNRRAGWGQVSKFILGASRVPNNYWHGMIDELAIYNRELSVEDVQLVMAGTPSLDTSVSGTHHVTYTARDSNGNSAEAIRTIIVAEDLSVPFIALHGLPELLHEAGAEFQDPGARASAQDGTVLEDAIPGVGEVDVKTPGEYTLTYNYTDADNNAAEPVTRKVTVVDTTAPVLTLAEHPVYGGTDVVKMKAGQSYSDPGATATDNLDDNLEVTDSLGIPEGLVAYYSFDNREDPGFEDTRNENEYFGVMKDGAGWTIAGKYGGGIAIPRSRNTARMEIQEAGIMLGPEWSVSIWFKELYPVGSWRTMFRGFSNDHQVIIGNDNDQLGTFLNASAGFVGSGFMMKPADYEDWHHIAAIGKGGETIFYVDGRQVGKSAGQSQTQIWQVGAYPGQRFAATIDEMAVFSTALDDAGVKAIMNSGKPLMTEFPGSYTVRYFAIDSTGNRSLAERTIIVEEDPSAPVMSLIGGPEIEYEAGTDFIDPGVAITTGTGEAIEGAVPEVEGVVDTSALGTYELTYRFKDADEKPAIPQIRTVTVVDNTPPEITLVGADPVTVPLGKTFADPGAIAMDKLDGEISIISSLSLPSGLVLHLDAGSFEGKVQDGEAIIDAWQDESGQGNHADQLQGDPTWVVDGLNGEPVVRFDGDDMIWTTKNFQQELTAYTILSVARYTGGVSERLISSRGRNWIFGFHGGITSCFYAEGWIFESGTTNTLWHSHIGTIDDKDRGNFWADGVHLAVDLNGASNTDYKPAIIQLGGWENGMQTSKGEVAELLLFNRVLSSAERELVQEHLHTKYDLNGGGSFKFGPIDTSTEGTHTIHYVAGDAQGNVARAERKVEIINDPLIPEITLLPNTDDEIHFDVEHGSDFVDPGASVSDQEGNPLEQERLVIAGSIDTSVLGLQELAYSYSDSEGREAQILKRVITIVDTTPPVISLKGNETTGIPIDGSFEDPGATATDAVDGEAFVLSSLKVPLEGLLGYWTFDESVGTSVRDVARNQIGTLNSFKGQYFVEGKQGNALYFDGVNDYVSLPLTAHPKLEDMQASFAFWAKGGSFLPRNTTILGSAGGGGMTFNIHLPYSNENIYWDAASNRIQKPAIPDEYKNNWVHWAFTINRETGDQRIYKDAEEWQVGTAKFAAWLQADRFNIGANAGPGLFWNGTLDNFAVYNRELTDAEVKTLHTGATVLDSSEENTRHTIKYQALDLTGNIGIMERTVVVSSDTTPPVITLIGEPEVSINVGEEYIDEGATAIDEQDGNLTPFVDDKGTVDAVDTSVPGEYVITYDVVDFAGNTAVQVTRKVTVVALATPWTTWFDETDLSNRPEAERAADADPDNDGMPNLIEYALGGNPLSSDRMILPDLEIVNGKLQITLVRLKATFDTKISFKPQVATSLSDEWSEIGITVEGALKGVSQAQLPDVKPYAQSRYERVRIIADSPVDATSGKQFLRVVVEQTE